MLSIDDKNRTKLNYFNDLHNEDSSIFIKERDKTIQVFFVKKNYSSSNKTRSHMINESMRNFISLRNKQAIDAKLKSNSFIKSLNQCNDYKNYEIATNSKKSINDKKEHRTNIILHKNKRKIQNGLQSNDHRNFVKLWGCLTILNCQMDPSSKTIGRNFRSSKRYSYNDSTKHIVRNAYGNYLQTSMNNKKIFNDISKAKIKHNKPNRNNFLHKALKKSNCILYEVRKSQNFPKFDMSQIIDKIVKRKKIL